MDSTAAFEFDGYRFNSLQAGHFNRQCIAQIGEYTMEIKFLSSHMFDISLKLTKHKCLRAKQISSKNAVDGKIATA